jgi:hypothetical protein
MEKKTLLSEMLMKISLFSQKKIQNVYILEFSNVIKAFFSVDKRYFFLPTHSLSILNYESI